MHGMESGVFCRDVSAVHPVEEHGSDTGVDRARQGSAAGQRLGPYRLLQEIGRGGMGTVYLARRDDGAFDRRVAVKIADRGLLSENRESRFRGERQILAHLDHPGVARLLDGGTTPTGELYLVMEHVDGTRIDEYCDENRLPIERRLELFRKVCDAVGYAHRHQVVHRDLKPANILVTAGGEPKLLDFGIAKLLDAGSFAAAVETTRTGEVPMTPSYASPEQIRGREVTAASDVFSLGVLLYELLTGRLPFRLTGVRSLAMERLLGEAEPLSPSATVEREKTDEVSLRRGSRPNQLRRRLTGDLDRIVLTALRKEPERRYSTAGELSEDLGRHLAGEPVAARGDSWLYRARRFLRRHRLVAAVAGTLLAVVLFEALRDSIRPPEVRPAVAVLGFENLSREPGADWLSTALAELVASELAAGGELRLIAAENVVRMKRDLELADVRTLAPDTLAAVGRNLGTDYVILGSYVSLGEAPAELRLQMSLQSAAGDSLAAVHAAGRDTDLIEIVRQTVSGVRRALDLGELSADEAASVRATLGASPEAVRLYSEGLRGLRAREAEAARRLFQQAVDADPGYALAHAALSEAFAVLGYDAQAAESARAALDLAEGLPRRDVLWIEGRYHEASVEWDEAVETYRILWGFYPDNVDYGLRLAMAQIAGGRPQDALGTTAALLELPPPANEDPRIHLAASKAAFYVPDSARTLESARQAVRLARPRQAWSLVADGRFKEAWALTMKGEYAAAEKGFAEARELYARLADRSQLARTLNGTASLAVRQCRFSQAESLFRQALQIQREIGARRHIQPLLMSLAEVLQMKGQLALAGERIEEARRLAQELDNRSLEATAVSQEAWRQLALGAPAAARELALQVSAISGDENRRPFTDLILGHVAAVTGELEDAREHLESAHSRCGGEGRSMFCGFTFHTLGDFHLIAGEIDEAEKAWEESRRIRSRLGEPSSLAELQLSAARLAMARDETQRAAALAAEAMAVFGEKEMPDREAIAAALRATALASLGETELGHQALERARVRVEVTEAPEVRLAFATAEARYLTIDKARKRLAGVAREAAGLGLVGYELEARLALGKLEIADGLSSEADGTGSFRLAGLAEEAAQRGFFLLARKARQAG